MTCDLLRTSSSVKTNRFMKTKGLKNKLKIFLGGICLFLSVFTFVLSIPVYIFRILVILLAKLFRPDLGDILNGMSSFLVNNLLCDKNPPRTSIIVSLVIEGRDLSIKEVKEILLERWIKPKDKITGKLTYEQFQQYPVRWMGFTFWKNSGNTFSIDNHVFLEEQKDAEGVDEEKLTNICEKILNARYPPKRSPWEVHLVKNYKSDHLSPSINNSNDQTAYAVIFKFHHCLADGYSILNVIVEEFGQHSLAKLPVPSSPKRNILERTAYYITFPFRTFYEFSYALSHIFHSSPWKVPDDKKEWYQICAKSDLISIQKVKVIKAQHRVSFTSVVLSAISSAICESISNAKQKKLDRDPEGIFKKDQEESSMYCMSLMPLPGHSNRLTNHFTIAPFDLPIDKYDKSVDRLHDVYSVLEETKKSCMPLGAKLYNTAIGCHFYPVGKLLGTQRMVAAALTNFPSVPVQIELNGRRCIGTDFLSGSPDGVQGVGIMVLSYGEYIRVAVVAEKAVMSKEEANRFVRDVANEIDQLYVSCCT